MCDTFKNNTNNFPSNNIWEIATSLYDCLTTGVCHEFLKKVYTKSVNTLYEKFSSVELKSGLDKKYHNIVGKIFKK